MEMWQQNNKVLNTVGWFIFYGWCLGDCLMFRLEDFEGAWLKKVFEAFQEVKIVFNKLFKNVTKFFVKLKCLVVDLEKSSWAECKITWFLTSNFPQVKL